MSIRTEKLAFVDIETSGPSHGNGGLTEIGIIRVEDGRVVQSYSQLLNPGMPIQPMIAAITGITDAAVADAPTFCQVAGDIWALLSDCVFAAHNACFDYGFLRHAFGEEGVVFDPPIVCTVRLSRMLYPQYRRHNLDEIILRHHIHVSSRHRAYDDATAIWRLYQCMLDEFDQATVHGAMEALLGGQSKHVRGSQRVGLGI